MAVLGLAGADRVVAQSGAQEKGAWRAASKTAQSVTGDVYFGGDKMAINFSSYVIAEIRDLKPAEVKATFDMDGDPVEGGRLYRLNIPGTKKFVHKNTLCGSEDTQWMVSYTDGRSLQLAFFSGTAMPVLTGEGMMNATDLCGTFMYER
ncbi:hypothetical protein GOB94_03900 [Granulicella sp. 5B5]|nr:hypothetical protein GOB94_03900 [Granulicella sp. 5B5]